MSSRIEQCALIGDTQTAALVGDDGSIDWFCVPRFDSEACFAALLGGEHNGRWLLAPRAGGRATRRRYRDGTLVLETEFDTPEGSLRVTGCMPIRDRSVDVVRLVEGLAGTEPMRAELFVRFDYGAVVPRVRRLDGAVLMIAGPNALRLATPVEVEGRELRHEADFLVREGKRVPFVLTWFPSWHREPPPGQDAVRAVGATTAWWQEWSGRSTYEGEWADVVQRSLSRSRRSRTRRPAGSSPRRRRRCPSGSGVSGTGTTAATAGCATPTFTLYSLMMAGYVKEAVDWRDLLLRAVAGDPSQLQIMYGPAGPASGASTSTSSTGSPATRARGRSGSGTPRRGSSSSMSTANSSTYRTSPAVHPATGRRGDGRAGHAARPVSGAGPRRPPAPRRAR